MAMVDGIDSGQHNQLSPLRRTHYGYNPHLPQHIYILGYFSGLFLDLLTH